MKLEYRKNNIEDIKYKTYAPPPLEDYSNYLSFYTGIVTFFVVAFCVICLAIFVLSIKGVEYEKYYYNCRIEGKHRICDVDYRRK